MSAMVRLRHWVSTRYAEAVEPLVFGRRQQARLAAFGVAGPAAMPRARLDLAAGSTCCAEQCEAWIARYRRYYSRFVRDQAAGGASTAGRGHMAILDLAAFADPAHYASRLRQASGNFHRDAARAQRLGYTVGVLEPTQRLQEMLEIRRSLRIRSFGIVLDAFTLRLDDIRRDLDGRRAWREGRCDRHWERWWGVFHAQADPGPEAGSRLVGYACVHRIGNVVRYAEFMGHGAHMRHGIMMALHSAVVADLLEARDAGLPRPDYLTYGAIEQGTEGLVFWKRKALFGPHVLALP